MNKKYKIFAYNFSSLNEVKIDMLARKATNYIVIKSVLPLTLLIGNRGKIIEKLNS